MDKNLKNRIPSDIFQNTTTSYKFFWCMSILELHKVTGKTVFDFHEIITRMIAESWMILSKYKLNFGGADHLQQTIKYLSLTYTAKYKSIQSIYDTLINDYFKRKQVRLSIRYYEENVPYRFLTPWIGTKIQRGFLNQEDFLFPLDVPYTIRTKGDGGRSIKLNPSWVESIKGNEDELISLVAGQLIRYLKNRKNDISWECEEYIKQILSGVDIQDIENLEFSTKDLTQKTYVDSIHKEGTHKREDSHLSTIDNIVSDIQSSYTHHIENKDDVIEDGKVIEIRDHRLLDILKPIVAKSKLEAISLLCKHYDSREDISMSFIEWGKLIDTIPSDEYNTNNESDTSFNNEVHIQTNSQNTLEVKSNEVQDNDLVEVSTLTTEEVVDSDNDSNRSSRPKIRVIFPSGTVFQPEKVLDALVRVVKYAGPERVRRLDIKVCGDNLILKNPGILYVTACKPVGGGWLVNTYSTTYAKYEQINVISERLNLGIKTEIVYDDNTKNCKNGISVDSTHLVQDNIVECSLIRNNALTSAESDEINERGLRIVDYSDKSFILYGDTSGHEKFLWEQYGIYNKHLPEGDGWVFSKKRECAIREFIDKISKNYKLNNFNNESNISKVNTCVVQPTESQVRHEIITAKKISIASIIMEEKRGFYANLRILKEFAHLPALREQMKKDSLTLEKFHFEYIKRWTPHRFNSASDYCDLVIVTDKNRKELEDCERYISNGYEIAKKPARGWTIDSFYNMFVSARKSELKNQQPL